MLKTCKMLLYIAILSALVAAPSTAYAATLNITVKTSKPSYQVSEYITIQGSLTYNGLPVQSNTVGLQVLDPDNNIVVSRTLQTNATGGYSLTFSLPADATKGTYTVQVSSTYNGVTATNSTSFTYTAASSSGGGITPLTTHPNVYIFRGQMHVIFGGGMLASMTFNVTVHRNDAAGLVPAIISLVRDNLTALSDYRTHPAHNYSLVGVPVPSKGWVWIPGLTAYMAVPAQTPVYPTQIIVGTVGGGSVSVTLTWYEDGVTSTLPANATWAIGAMVGIAPGAGALYNDTNPSNNQVILDPNRYNYTALTATTEVLHGSTTYEPYYSLIGDVNGDGRVDILDAIALSNSFLKVGNNLPTDINNDGVVNILDAILLANNFNNVLPFLTGLPS
jgi:hypothetical protein